MSKLWPVCWRQHTFCKSTIANWSEPSSCRAASCANSTRKAAPPPAASPAAPDDKSISKDDDYTRVLAQIVETQHQIQVRQLDLESALALVADRLTLITGRAVLTSELSREKPSATKPEAVVQRFPAEANSLWRRLFALLVCARARSCAAPMSNPEFLLDAEECHRRGIQSLIAVPVYHDGGVIGALELYFA